MIKYKSFPIEKEKEINKFISEHKDEISYDGIMLSDGQIVFLYAEPNPDKRDKNTMLQLIEQWKQKVMSSVLSNKIQKSKLIKASVSNGQKSGIDEVAKIDKEKRELEQELNKLKEIENEYRES